MQSITRGIILASLIGVGIVHAQRGVAIDGIGVWNRPASGGGCATAKDSNSAGENVAYYDSVGIAAAQTYLADTFSAGSAYSLCKTILRMSKTGTPTGTLTLYVYTDNAGVPGAQVGGASDAVTANTLTTDPTIGDVTFTFSGTLPSISSGATYWLVVKATGAANDWSNYVRWIGSTGSGQHFQVSQTGTTWAAGTQYVDPKFVNYE